jgi:M6 family metalloprotease-like protein
MKKKILWIAYSLFLVSMCRSVLAMPANPVPFEVKQPDGKKISIYIRGDERFHWYEDTDGYTVVNDKGRYAYGRLDKDKRLTATPLTVGVDNPRAAGLRKKILPPASVRRSMSPMFLSGRSESPTAPAMVPASGTVKNLVVLCKFSDHTLGVQTRDPADYNVLFNQVGGDPTLAPTGSVKDLYLQNSYNTMTMQSTVTVWVTLPNTEAYYADGQDGTGSYPYNAQKMVEDALNQVDPLVDFSQFDNDLDGYIDAIDIIHSGYGAEAGGGGGNWIWSHQWSLWALPSGHWTSNDKNSNNVNVKVYDYHTEPALWGTSGTDIVRFGVIAHETGHFFGLPDLYDTDGSWGEGIGSWCLMANSWGFDNSQLHPPHFSVWSKIQLGWVTPTVISAPGTYTVGQAETNPQAYRINYGYPSGEYLLIENRQPAGIESAMPQGGLCIFHVDEAAGYYTEGYPGQSGWPANGNHYKIALLQADGYYDLEHGNNRGDQYDVYHAAGVSQIGTGPGNYPNTDAYQGGTIIITNNVINSISAASASMNFTYQNGSVPQPPVAQAGSVGAQINTPVTITLAATDDGLPNPPGHLSYIITSLPAHGGLSDPSGGAISSVPYTIIGGGNQVVYTPTTGYSGSDSFTFKANDGGTPPNGGDSNPANITISVSSAMVFLTEGFESAFVSGAPPSWSKSFKTGTTDWTRNSGDYRNDGAHTGSYNALLFAASFSSHETYLITPAINFPAGTQNATLKFWHKQANWTGDQDTLTVYYKIGTGGTWTLLASYTSNVSIWTERTISLPNAGSNYYIGFLGNAKYGYGVCIDDVTVTGTIAQMKTLTMSSTSGGHTDPIAGSHQYTSGTVVNINAIPDTNYQFVNWTGTGVTLGKVANPNSANTTITVDANLDVTANFTLASYTLFVNSYGASNASISSSTGHGGTTNYTKTVLCGTTVTLTAPLKADGNDFTGWTGDINDISRTITFVMNGNRNVTANFKTLTPVLRAEANMTPGFCNRISWNPVPDAKEYYAECSSDPCFFTVDCNSGWITRTSYLFCDLTLCQDYWYRVKSGFSAWSQTSQAEFQTDALTNTTATSGSDVILLSASGTGTVGGTNAYFDTSTDWYFNGFLVTTETTLTQIEIYLGISSSTSIEFVVYEGGTSFSDPYNRIHSSTLANSGTGTKFYSSGPITVSLHSGRHYMIGALCNGSVTMYYNDTASSPAFAIYAGWGYYTGFPSPGTLTDIYSDPPLTFYCRYSNAQAGGGYVNSGSIVSSPISLPAGGSWGKADFNAVTPASTALTVDVLPAAGSTPITGYANVSIGADLSGISNTTIRLRANLSTTDPNKTPALGDWSVTYADPAGFESGWSNIVFSTQVIPGDFGPDCKVDWHDFTVLLNKWRQAPGTPSADIAPSPDGDGIVNYLDLAEFAEYWLTEP